jgi:hypothetical protein
VTLLLSEYTGNHSPLDIDWSFASARAATHLEHLGRPQGVADRLVASDSPGQAAGAAAEPAVRRPAPPREPAKMDAPFANLLEFASAVNRANPVALALAETGRCDFPVDGADVRKLLGTLWFRTVVSGLSDAWRTRLFDALRSSLEIPNHVVRVGRQSARLSDLTYAQLCEAAASPALPDAMRADLELLVTIGRVWGEAAPRQVRYREAAAAAAPSRFASFVQGFRPRL